MGVSDLRFPDKADLLPLIKTALAEDGAAKDITTAALISADMRGRAWVEARVEVVVAGLPLLEYVFDEIDPRVAVDIHVAEGEAVAADTCLATVEGPLRALLTGERTALNFIQRTCGVATTTRRFVDKVKGTRCRLVDTRKTIPGWRVLDKYAVRAGGGWNHRMGLWDAVLIKENHIDAGMSPDEAVLACRRAAPGAGYVEVEVRSLEEVEAALPGKPDIIMLDNFRIDDIRRAVDLIRRKAGEPENGGPLIEVSGNVGCDGTAEIAAMGVDRIAVGRITHSARAADIAMTLEPVGER
jgi:nicotinate-nucleotide pyrophosphorylase (carboxylating)